MMRVAPLACAALEQSARKLGCLYPHERAEVSMAGSYSTDLRERVLAAVGAGATPEAAARRFAVGRSTAYRWATAARLEGRRAAKRMGGGPKPRITGEVEVAFLDECGVLTGMARLHGRSPRGTRASGEVPHGSWTRLSVLGALGREGMLAAMSVQAATDGAVFRAYLERVMDNLGAHKTPKVRELLDGSGFPYRYLPSYSPDLSPIEPAWAQVKAEPRRVAVRDKDALHRALGPALDRVSAANAAAYFRHCGYE